MRPRNSTPPGPTLLQKLPQKREAIRRVQPDKASAVHEELGLLTRGEDQRARQLHAKSDRISSRIATRLDTGSVLLEAFFRGAYRVTYVHQRVSRIVPVARIGLGKTAARKDVGA